MRTLLLVMALMWAAFVLLIGFWMFLYTPEQIEKDKIFVEEELRPAVSFVKSFKKENNRLPSNREFYTWERDYYNDYSSDLNQDADSLVAGLGRVQYIRNNSDIASDDLQKFKQADWDKDFAIGVWRGDWWEYYYSWTDSYDTNSYSWDDGIIGLIWTTLIGAFPLLLLWYYRRKSKTHNMAQA
ncbi:hypothetical protein [Pontibacter roseus]|uniref:hypothetical protein n=1 Tax=Pontibacter roseus TaxID=336989 RepID=UPI0003742378|nr:hypothetical protein [Pontibacter roseus]